MRGYLGAAAGLLAAAVLMGCMPGSEAKDEELPYTVASVQEDFEIREYAPQLWAQHSARGTYRSAVERGYIRLERYFTGENTVPEPIEMSPPVVVRDDGAEGWTVMFPLPGNYQVETAPRPVDQRIRLVELPARRVAALSFRGGLDEAVLQERAAKLAAMLEAQGLAHRGDFALANYSPPGFPARWQKNAVLVTLR